MKWTITDANIALTYTCITWGEGVWGCEADTHSHGMEPRHHDPLC